MKTTFRRQPKRKQTHHGFVRGEHTWIERRVIEQKIDGAAGEWVVILECGHVHRTPANRGAVKFTVWKCAQCGHWVE